MGWISEITTLFERFGHKFRAFIEMPEKIDKLFLAQDDCKTDIKSVRRFSESINTIVLRIDEYGSKGAIVAIKEVGSNVTKLDDKLQEREGKLYDRIKQLDDKLDVAALDVARLQGIVINGKTPAH